MARHLRVGLVFDDGLGQARQIERAIVEYAQRKPDWVLLLHDASDFKIRTLQTMRPTCLIAHVISEELADVLRSQRRPVVNVGPLLSEDISFPYVGVDNREIGRLAYSHLRSCGLQSFGFVGHRRHVYSAEREAGFREALVAAGRSYEQYYERPVRSYRHRARLLALSPDLQRWLRRLPKPIGVFTCHDVVGVQVIEACRLVGLRVPDDVAVIGVDNDEVLCELARPSLSSVNIPAQRIGLEAAALLERLMDCRRPAAVARTMGAGTKAFLPPCGVVARESTELMASTDPHVSSAARFIRRQAHRPINVEDVLCVVPVSRRYLEKRFRSILHRGIAEEIRRVHLDRAKVLLATTMLSVSEIAEKAGFSSVYYMSHVFRRETGQTPTSFRSQFHAS